MPTSTHTFAGANTDDQVSAPGMGAAFVAANNIMLESGQVFPVTGNVAVPGYTLPGSGVTRSLGGFVDGATGTAVCLLHNTDGAHRLVRYDAAGNAGAGACTTLLEWPGLNLTATLTLWGGIIDGLLIYLGADGYLRSIDLARMEAGQYTPARLANDPFCLHLVKPAPKTPPVALRMTGTGSDPREGLRIVSSKAYQFAYRFRYEDGTLSVLSPYSYWVDIMQQPTAAGNTYIEVFFNDLSFNTYLSNIPLSVSEVEILVREPESLTWAVAETVRRRNGVLAGKTRFYGLVSGAEVAEADSLRLFEAEWPGSVAALARSRAFKGDITEGYLTTEPAFRATIRSSIYFDSIAPTFHESAAHRVVLQFYDAQNKPFGCSQPVVVYVPVRGKDTTQRRFLEVLLTTTDPVALNLEIPEEADSCQFLISPNDTTTYFLQGMAADVLGYIGRKIIKNDDNGDIDYIDQFVDATITNHEKLVIDIGNFPTAGQGYVLQPGDQVKFLAENKSYPITAQRGDYLEIIRSDYPFVTLDPNGNAQALIEIFRPNTAPTQLYYERGPRIGILRTTTASGEQRSYSQISVAIEGDCFLMPLNFTTINRDNDGYAPPNKKEYRAATGPTIIESMVPPYRLAPTSSRTTIVHEKQQRGLFDGGLLGFISNNKSVNVSTTVIDEADTANRSASNLKYLDMSYGGRPGVIIPTRLQRVHRPALIRHSGQKQVGNEINGLARWEALSQYDKLPQEQGSIQGMAVADQSQTDGSVLVALQQYGAVSLYLGQQPIQTDATQKLLAITSQVIGGDNTLKGGLGCVDGDTVEVYAGKLFYFSRERAELVRYNNGLTPLALTYKFRFRLQALAALYAGARITGCFDPRREEYHLTFEPVRELHGCTVVWSERREAWADALGYTPEAGLGLNNELLTWQGGDLHRHTPTAPVGTFFGRYTAPSLTFVAAQPGGNLAKTWQQVGVQSQAQWVPVLLSTPAGQRSRILPSWQKFIQGVWRAAVRRDENSPGFALDTAKALHNGRVLQSESLTVTLTCPEQNPAPLVGATVDFLVNTGQFPNQ